MIKSDIETINLLSDELILKLKENFGQEYIDDNGEVIIFEDDKVKETLDFFVKPVYIRVCDIFSSIMGIRMQLQTKSNEYKVIYNILQKYLDEKHSNEEKYLILNYFKKYEFSKSEYELFVLEIKKNFKGATYSINISEKEYVNLMRVTKLKNILE